MIIGRCYTSYLRTTTFQPSSIGGPTALTIDERPKSSGTMPYFTSTWIQKGPILPVKCSRKVHEKVHVRRIFLEAKATFIYETAAKGTHIIAGCQVLGFNLGNVTN